LEGQREQTRQYKYDYVTGANSRSNQVTTSTIMSLATSVDTPEETLAVSEREARDKEERLREQKEQSSTLILEFEIFRANPIYSH
jgi:hypothetical protein